MSLPPLSPLSHNGKDVSYFEMAAITASKVLNEYGIKLNFDGYLDTVKNYHDLDLNDTGSAWELSKELNAWSEYFSDMSNIVQKILLDAETESSEIQAMSSIKHDSEKVSNGNRLSYQDKDVVTVRKKRNVLKAFYDELEAKVKFLERAHYHCKATFDIASKSKYPVFPTSGGFK